MPTLATEVPHDRIVHTLKKYFVINLLLLQYLIYYLYKPESFSFMKTKDYRLEIFFPLSFSFF